MSEAQLALYSGWASIIGLLVSLISLAYVRSIKANIVKFRRKQRVRQLTDDILRIQDDAAPLSPGSRSTLAALKRNLPIHPWSRLTAKGRAVKDMLRLAQLVEAQSDKASKLFRMPSASAG